MEGIEIKKVGKTTSTKPSPMIFRVQLEKIKILTGEKFVNK